MWAVNRSALVVTPKKPFRDWAASIDAEAPKHAAELLNGHFSVYLVPPDPKEEQESAPLKGFFRVIFEQELESWCTDPELWPKRRDLRTFLDWFDARAESLVWDTVDAPLDTEDW